MTIWRARRSDTVSPAFGERFAAAQTLGMAGLAGFCWMTVVDSGRVFPLVAAALVLGLSLGFRRRAAWEASTPRRVAEDERDRLMVAAGDRAFRVWATLLMAAFALAHTVPALRVTLFAEPLRPAGVLLTAMILANAAAYAVVWRAHVRDRQ